MKQKFWGVLVLVLLGIAVLIATIVIFKNTVILGFIYLGISFLGAAALIYFFCAKCSRKKNCPHVLPGKAALLFDRKIVPYTKVEITVVIISIFLIVGIPQFWLRFHLIPIIAFWLLIISSLVLIPLLLCPRCNNKFCPLKYKNK